MSAPILHQLDFVAGAATALALNALWEGALLALCVYLLMRLWPGLNAATRYLIWSATLIAAVVVPIGTTLPFLATSTPATSAVHTRGLTHAQTHSARPLRIPAQLAQPYRTQAQPAPALAPAARRVPPSAPAYSVPSARLPQRFYLTVPVQLALAVLAIWALIALVSLARLAIGLLKLETLKRNALPLPIEYRDDMRRWNQASKGSRPVRLCVSDDVDVPVAVGLFDAMILIPRELLERLSHAEVDQISLHELAHLRRADDWSNGLHRVVLALFAWNPAALFIGRQLDLEREVACDDCVLALTGMVRPYALTLTKMAETSALSYRPVPAPGVFATRKQISLRIERLLGAGRNAATNLSLGPAAATIAIVAALAFAMQLIAPSIAAPAGHAANVVAASAKPPVASAKPVEKTAAREHFVYVRVAQTATAPAATERVAGTAVASGTSVSGASNASAGSGAPSASASPAAIASPNEAPSKPGTKLKVVQTEVRIPATHVHVPARKLDFPAIDVEVPGQIVKLPKFGDFPKFVGDTVQSSLAVAGVGSSSAASLAHASAATALAHADASAGVRVADGSPVRSCNACDLSDVDWSGRDLRNASYVGSDFSRAKLQGTDFSGGNFSGVDFSHANLRSASFRNAKLTGCDFSNADLTGADFTGATLGGCEFTHALLPAAQMHAVLNTCTGCDFSHADLRGQDLSNVHARAIDFSHANLEGANLAGSQFVGTDFSGANLNNANFNGTLLSGCDLAGVDLSHVDLSRAKLIGTDLSSGRKPHP